IQRVEIRTGAEALSDDELLAELTRRLQRSSAPMFLGRPGSVPAEVLARMQHPNRNDDEVTE
ncbi:MAG: hypothetical protein JWR88_772, partial [Pseudonocardia sp.]|nr:hypothetical protein [Pseudonocardia sp.]